MANPVIHFEVTGNDSEALGSFYGALFGWQVNPMNAAPYAMVAPEDDGIAGGIGAAWEGRPPESTFYVGVDDVEAALASAEKLGAKRLLGPLGFGRGELGLFADPEGNTVGLWHSKA